MKKIHYFNITYRCNSNCLFCAADHGLNNTNKEMSIEEFENVIKSNGVDSSDRVIINGGEPTVHQNFFDVLKIVKKRNAYIDLFTNGVKLHDLDFTKKLLEYTPILIRIPFFGSDELTHDYLTGISGNFNKAVKGVENLLKLKKNKLIEIEIKLLLSKATLNENVKIFDYFANQFPNEFYFSLNPLLISERVKQNKDLMVEKYSTLINSSLDLIEYMASKGWTLSLDLLPFCLFPEKYYVRYLDKVDRDYKEFYSDPNITYEVDNHYTSFKCNNCALNKVCAGFPSSYIDYMGDEEVFTIH